MTYSNHHKITSIESENGWFNIYEKLIEKISLFPKRISWKYRKESYSKLPENKNEVSCINGLVLNDPDIDAVTRLTNRIEVMGMKDDLKLLHKTEGHGPQRNNQNTIIQEKLFLHTFQQLEEMLIFGPVSLCVNYLKSMRIYLFLVNQWLEIEIA